MGLTEEELPGLVSTWRSANPHITAFWWVVDEAAVTAVRDKNHPKWEGCHLNIKAGFCLSRFRQEENFLM